MSVAVKFEDYCDFTMKAISYTHSEAQNYTVNAVVY